MVWDLWEAGASSGNGRTLFLGAGLRVKSGPGCSFLGPFTLNLSLSSHLKVPVSGRINCVIKFAN